ncbi:MAG: MBL fold metallo-hydrolase, partial [Candidatus Dadabacteria bacterium]
MTKTNEKNPLYLRQLQIGPMANYVYLLGDRERREAVVIDPAWDIEAILEQLERDGMRLTGALVTHFHPDHIGGDLMGYRIPGLPELLARRPVRIYVHKNEADYVRKMFGLSATDVTPTDGETVLRVGRLPVRVLHTPGHSPGSSCFLAEGNLISGDTLFIGSCGRVDLPGANPKDLYYSLTQKLAKLPDDTVVYPGHDYASAQSSTIGQEKRSNVFMRFDRLEDFLRLMGYP